MRSAGRFHVGAAGPITSRRFHSQKASEREREQEHLGWVVTLQSLVQGILQQLVLMSRLQDGTIMRGWRNCAQSDHEAVRYEVRPVPKIKGKRDGMRGAEG